MSNQGWQDMEAKLNEKTAQRRALREAASHARRLKFAKMRRWIFYGLEMLLGAIGVGLLIAYVAGAIHAIVFLAIICIVNALMTFCAGYFLGATKH